MNFSVHAATKRILAILAVIVPAGSRYAWAEETHPTCVVMTLEAKEDATASEAAQVSDRLEPEVGRLAAPKVWILPRSQAAAVLQAKEATLECGNMACAMKAAQLLAATYVVFGTLEKTGTTYTARLYLASVPKGEILRRGGCLVTGTTAELLDGGVPAAARHLLGISEEAAKAAESSAAAGTAPAGFDDLKAKVKAKEALDKELAAQVAKRKATFDKQYADYLAVVTSSHADAAVKKEAWRRISSAWNVEDPGATPRVLRFDSATGDVEAGEAVTGLSAVPEAAGLDAATGEINEKGPIGHWALEDAANSEKVEDTAGDNDAIFRSGNRPEPTAKHSIAGQVGRAMEFDGSHDWISTVSSVGIQGDQPRALCYWVNVRQPSGSGHLVNWGFNDSNGRSFGNFFDAKGVLWFWGCNLDFSAGFYIRDKDWHFIADVYDGIKIYVYVDGNLTHAEPYKLNTVSAPLNIGSKPSGVECFRGRVDDVLVFDRSLSQQEVQALYIKGGGKPSRK